MECSNVIILSFCWLTRIGRTIIGFPSDHVCTICYLINLTSRSSGISLWSGCLTHYRNSFLHPLFSDLVKYGAISIWPNLNSKHPERNTLKACCLTFVWNLWESNRVYRKVRTRAWIGYMVVYGTDRQALTGLSQLRFYICIGGLWKNWNTSVNGSTWWLESIPGTAWEYIVWDHLSPFLSVTSLSSSVPYF